MRDGVEADLDRVLREALVVEPPPELQARLMALVAAAPLAPAAAPARRARSGRDLNVWLGLLAVLALGWSSWSALAWLTGDTIVIGDVGAALVLLASSPAAGLLPSLGVDVYSLALWCGAGLVGWLLAATGALDAAAPRRSEGRG